MLAESIIEGIWLSSSANPSPTTNGSPNGQHLQARWSEIVWGAADDSKAEQWLHDLRRDFAQVAFAVATRSEVERGVPAMSIKRDPTLVLLHVDIIEAWNRAPGLLPMPRDLPAISIAWLGNALFELVRRIGIPALRDRPACMLAARWAYHEHPETTVLDDTTVNPWSRLRKPLRLSDLGIE